MNENVKILYMTLKVIFFTHYVPVQIDGHKNINTFIKLENRDSFLNIVCRFPLGV